MTENASPSPRRTRRKPNIQVDPPIFLETHPFFLSEQVVGHRNALLDQALRPLGLNASRWKIMVRIHFQPGIAMSQLAGQTTLSPSALSRATDGLVDQGLVLRQNDSSDKRVMRLMLSEPGEALFAKANRLVERENAAILKDVSAAERAALAKILRRLRAAAVSRIGTKDETCNSN